MNARTEDRNHGVCVQDSKQQVETFFIVWMCYNQSILWLSDWLCPVSYTPHRRSTKTQPPHLIMHKWYFQKDKPKWLTTDNVFLTSLATISKRDEWNASLIHITQMSKKWPVSSEQLHPSLVVRDLPSGKPIVFVLTVISHYLFMTAT